MLLLGGVVGLRGYGPSMRSGARDCTGSGARDIQLEKEKSEFSRMEKKNSTVSEEAARLTDPKDGNKALEAEEAARLTDSKDSKDGNKAHGCQVAQCCQVPARGCQAQGCQSTEVKERSTAPAAALEPL